MRATCRMPVEWEPGSRTLYHAATGVLMAALTPTVPGAYHIRAVIESASLPDPNAANNQFTWTYSTPSQQVVSWKIYLPILVR